MAAATESERMEGKLATDTVLLEATDGETYVTKLSDPIGAILQVADSTSITSGSACNLDYSLSTRTFTIRFKNAGVAVTDGKVMLRAYGRL